MALKGVIVCDEILFCDAEKMFVYLSVADMSLSLAPLHIPAIRPGFETDTSAAVKRHPHPWPYESDGFSSAQYHHASQYYLDRDRKPVFYGYPESQFQVNI